MIVRVGTEAVWLRVISGRGRGGCLDREEPVEVEIRRQPGEAGEQRVSDEVGGVGACRPGRARRRRIPRQKKGHRRERSKNDRRQREGRQQGQQGRLV